MSKIISAFWFVLIFVSCSQAELFRTVRIEIPQHPWEEVSENDLWYTLKVTDGEEIKSMHISNNVRNVSLKIPLGETVYVCAFPLGNMEPFGIGITPLDDSNLYLLSQSGGCLARIFMEQEADIRMNVNYPVVEELCYSLTDDFRKINEVELISAAVNGKITKGAVQLNKPTEVPELSVPEGVWVSENQLDDVVRAPDGKFPSVKLMPGTHRYLCAEQNREIRIIVGYDGTVQAVLKQSIVSI